MAGDHLKYNLLEENTEFQLKVWHRIGDKP